MGIEAAEAAAQFAVVVAWKRGDMELCLSMWLLIRKRTWLFGPADERHRLSSLGPWAAGNLHGCHSAEESVEEGGGDWEI